MRHGPDLEQKSHVFFGQALIREWLQAAGDIIVHLWIQLDRFVEISWGSLSAESDVFTEGEWTPTAVAEAQIPPCTLLIQVSCVDLGGSLVRFSQCFLRLPTAQPQDKR